MTLKKVQAIIVMRMVMQGEKGRKIINCVNETSEIEELVGICTYHYVILFSIVSRLVR